MFQKLYIGFFFISRFKCKRCVNNIQVRGPPEGSDTNSDLSQWHHSADKKGLVDVVLKGAWDETISFTFHHKSHEEQRQTVWSTVFINLETWKKCVEPSTVWMKSIMNKRKECVLYKSDNVGAQWKAMEYDWSHWWIFNEDHSTCIIHALKSEMVTQFYAAFENREDLLIVLGIRKK